MRVLVTTLISGAALLAASAAFAQSTVNNGPGDTYRGKPNQGALDRSTVGLKSAAVVQPPEQLAPKPVEGLDSSASQTLNPTTANGAPPPPVQAPTGVSTPVASSEVVIPTGWAGTAQQWTEHTRACAKRYRSYDSATDHFVPSRGKSAKCVISVPK